mmetsp:Transcript_4073/g.8778  ORF Transcript_4073/g.8778 Transcript_4073/m.8778 type:complete len:820 (+) Transcript_4073:87-2546(+)
MVEGQEIKVLRVAVLVCEDTEEWNDLGSIWAKAIFGGSDLTDLNEETQHNTPVQVRHGGQDNASSLLSHLHAKDQQEGLVSNNDSDKCHSGLNSVHEVIFFNAFERELPRKDLLFRSGQDGGIDVVIITGSRHSVNDPEQAEWVNTLEDLVRLLVKGRPNGTNETMLARPRIVAGCFGCQLVARALGGQVAPNPDGKFVFGAETIVPSPAMSLFPWAPIQANPMRILESHGECVESLPPGAVLLASSKSCKHEIFYVPVLAEGTSFGGSGGILAMQSHPEFELIHMFDRILPSIDAAGLLSAMEASTGISSMEEEPLDDDRLLGLIRSFIQGERIDIMKHFSTNDSPELLDIISSMRESFRDEIARVTSTYEATLANLRARSSLDGNDDGVDNVYNTYSQESDVNKYALAEALLRGEAKLPGALGSQFPPGLGHRAAMIHVNNTSLVPPFSDQNENVQTYSGIHSMNILCCAGAFFNSFQRPLLLSGAADKLLCIVDPSTGQMPVAPYVCSAPVLCIRIRPGFETGDHVLVACMDGKIEFLHIVSKSAISKEESFKPDKQIANSSSNYGWASWESSDQIQNHGKMATALAWSIDGQWFATAGRDNKVHVYTFNQTGDIVHSQTMQCADCPEALTFVPCFGSTCLAVAVRGEFRMQYLCVARVEPQATLPVGSIVRVNMNAKGDDFVSFTVLDMACAPGGVPILAVATDKSRIILFKAGSSQQLRNLYGHTCTEFSRSRIAWDPSGRFLISNSEGNSAIVVWDVVTGEKIQELHGHTQSVRDVAILNTNCGVLSYNVLSCSFDKTIQLHPLQESNIPPLE